MNRLMVNVYKSFAAVCIFIDRFLLDTPQIRYLPFDGIGAQSPTMT
jgi:hypothetical protein